MSKKKVKAPFRYGYEQLEKPGTHDLTIEEFRSMLKAFMQIVNNEDRPSISVELNKKKAPCYCDETNSRNCPRHCK